jgi:hypothetical protein
MKSLLLILALALSANTWGELKTKENLAQIDIGRSGFVGAGIKHDLYIDDKFVVTQKGNSAISVRVEPGDRIFCYRATRKNVCSNKFTPIDKMSGVVTGMSDKVLIKLESNQRLCLKMCFADRCNGFEYLGCDQWDVEFTKSGRFKNSKRLTKINY